MTEKETASTEETFEMEMVSECEESDDDDEEELFVRKNGSKSYDNGAAKRPLIKGSKEKGRKKMEDPHSLK